METDTPDPAERFTILRGELRLRFDAHGPRHGIARVVDVLMWHLFMHLISVFESLAKRRAERQACGDGAGAAPVGALPSRARQILRCDAVIGEAEPGRVGAHGGFAAAGGGGGAERRAAADGPDAGRRVVARAGVAAAAADKPVIDAQVIDGATHDDCIRDERAVGAACERRHRERRHLAANRATMGRGVAGLEYGCRVLEVRFAKIGLRTWVEFCRFHYELATMAGCCGE